MKTDTPLTDAVAQNFHVIAATEKIQVSQYVKAWQCREIETQLNAECTRLHSHWHAAEERANVAEARLKDRDERLRKLSNAASVLWEEHKAFGEDVHDTEGVDYLGSDSEGHAMMQALVNETLTKSADGKPDGQEEN